MTSYAEMDHTRKLARVLYLELRALGLGVIAHEDPDAPSGYRVELVGARFLSPVHADQIRRRVEEATPGLLRVLWARWDEDLAAVRREGASR